MNEKYRPSSGTEGSAFFEAWCAHCARDKPMSEGKNFDECGPDEVCSIIGDTFAYEVDDPKYPVEWIVDADGPKCTAFVPACGGVPRSRCEKTVDMFPEVKP